MNVLAELLGLAEKIPATFWGVVIGSFFSLGGVVLTNRAHDRRLRAQLAHDRDLRSRERELSLRKDVYLVAAEAISAGLTTIGRFADLDLPHDKLTDAYIEKSPSIAKVHVIAKEETARAIANFAGELGAAYLRLFAKRYPLVADKAKLEFLRKQMDDSGRECDRMLELMKQFNLDGAADQRRWDLIQRNFGFEQDRIAETLKQHDELAANLCTRQLEYMKECIAENVRLSRLLVPALVAVRAELELPIDRAAYTQLVEQGIEKQETAIGEFLQDLQRFTAAQPSAPADPPQAARR